MNILIGLVSILIGAAISYYVLNKKLFSISQKNIQLETKLEEKEKNYTEKLQLVEHLKNQVNNEFKTIASEILKTDRDKLKVDNSDLLSPLQTQLKSFRERIETITKEQVEERTTLKEQIKSLHDANLETQQSAKSLTDALTYDNKIQGDWGEEILSSLLSSYGFQEGVEFDLQKQYKNEIGEKFKPESSKITLDQAFKDFHKNKNNPLKSELDRINKEAEKSMGLKTIEKPKAIAANQTVVGQKRNFKQFTEKPSEPIWSSHLDDDSNTVYYFNRHT